MIRGVMEGVAYMIRKNLEVMDELHGQEKTLRVFGGGAKSALWCQIIADITGCRVETVYTPETATIGAAVLAGLGSGAFGDPEEARAKIGVEGVYECRKDTNYDQRYQDYMAILEKLLF